MLTEKHYIRDILIVLNEDGSFKGAHQDCIHEIYKDGQLLNAPMCGAEPLTQEALAKVLPDQAELLAQLQKQTDDIGLLTQTLSERDQTIAQQEATIVELRSQIDALTVETQV